MQGVKTTKLEPISEARRAPRLVPAESVTVALLERGLPFVYGVVNNISEGGACVQTSDVSTRRGVHVMLSFSNGEMLEARGRVVWSKSLETDGGQSLYGIEFTGLSVGERKTLRTLLGSRTFTAPDC